MPLRFCHPEQTDDPGWFLHLDDILPRMLSRNQLLPVLIQFGDGGLLGLQTLADEVLYEEGQLARMH